MTYDASRCDNELPEGFKVAPRDLRTDLVRLDELLIGGVVDAAVLVRARNLLAAVRAEADRMPAVPGDTVTCGYEGLVDAEIVYTGTCAYTATWACPVCGCERSEDRDGMDD